MSNQAFRRPGPWWLAAAAALGLSAGCRQDMHDAPRYDPLEASVVLPRGASAQPIIDGTVPRDHLKGDELLETGRANGAVADVFPFAIAQADLDRGEERFNIYCSPCHGREGDGNGMVVQRGFRQAASLHTDRLRQAKAGYLYEVVRNGFGVMPDYRDQIPTEDRWRIVAYIRALQLSRHAALADVPAADASKLDAPAAGTAPAVESKEPAGGQN